jgi:hypothetical protein
MPTPRPLVELERGSAARAGELRERREVRTRRRTSQQIRPVANMTSRTRTCSRSTSRASSAVQAKRAARRASTRASSDLSGPAVTSLATRQRGTVATIVRSPRQTAHGLAERRVGPSFEQIAVGAGLAVRRDESRVRPQHVELPHDGLARAERTLAQLEPRHWRIAQHVTDARRRATVRNAFHLQADPNLGTGGRMLEVEEQRFAVHRAPHSVVAA